MTPPRGSATARATAAPALDAGAPARCRVVMGEGARSDLDLEAWLDLPEKTFVVVRETATARELRLVGPLRARPCTTEEGAELASGTVSAMPGGGEAPGNEQVVATPCGVARWIAGRHSVAATDSGCTVRVSSGALAFAPADDVDVAVAPDGGDAGAGGRAARGDDGIWRADGRVVLQVTASKRADGGGPLGGPEARARAAAACARATAREADAAARLAAIGRDGSATGQLGEWTAEHVALRRAARAACGIRRAREAGHPASNGR